MSSMMRKIIKHSCEHRLKNQKIVLPYEYPCVAFSKGKLIVRPSFSKVTFELPVFLKRIHEDICGPIHPSCGPFCYFMVLIGVCTSWSHVCLISIRNVAFVRLLAQMINYKPNFLIIQLRLSNLTTRVSLPPKPLMTITCQLG